MFHQCGITKHFNTCTQRTAEINLKQDILMTFLVDPVVEILIFWFRWIVTPVDVVKFNGLLRWIAIQLITDSLQQKQYSTFKYKQNLNKNPIKDRKHDLIYYFSY